MSEEKKQVLTPVDSVTAKSEFDRWCFAWKIGKKRAKMKGEDKDQADAQEEIIVGLIEEGRLRMDDKKVLHYVIEEPQPGLPVEFDIPRPKGDMVMEADRFKEQQAIHKAYAMIAAAVGYDQKAVMKLEYNTDVTQLMAVIGHFLTA